MFQHGSVEVKPAFITQKNYTFVTNCYQAVILMLFNRQTSYTYTEVLEQTSIPKEELNAALVYLCNPKQKILDKENMKKPQFGEGEKITVTATFSNNNLKVSFVPSQTHKKKTIEKTPDDIRNETEIRQER